MTSAEANDSASPIHAVFHSQSFRRQTSARGVFLVTVGPGTKSIEMTKVMAAGPRTTAHARAVTDTVSGV
jgi:hypothetical protein